MHVIRLRRPWNKSHPGGFGSTRIDVPESIANQEFPDETTVQYRRRFHLPAGLQSSSRVFLRVEGWEGQLESITMNGAALALEKNDINADITAQLQPHNHVEITLSSIPGQSARLSGEVSLAIDETDAASSLK